MGERGFSVQKRASEKNDVKPTVGFNFSPAPCETGGVNTIKHSLRVREDREKTPEFRQDVQDGNRMGVLAHGCFHTGHYKDREQGEFDHIDHKERRVFDWWGSAFLVVFLFLENFQVGPQMSNLPVYNWGVKNALYALFGVVLGHSHHGVLAHGCLHTCPCGRPLQGHERGGFNHKDHIDRIDRKGSGMKTWTFNDCPKGRLRCEVLAHGHCLGTGRRHCEIGMVVGLCLGRGWVAAPETGAVRCKGACARPTGRTLRASWGLRG
ncbi:MAG: hypothetical protein JWR26_432 [Pedosphaera sp.]|nr:hypothetical protein [Pedosphaera sp.]